nr:hypothetical protein [Tanacetum cinerariifolium]
MKNDKSFKVHQSQEFCKEREQYFEIQYLKAQLQDKGVAISELKKLTEKLKGKSVNTKFEKSLVIRQPNAFKSQRQSILGKPTIFSGSLERKYFSKLKSVTKNNVSNDFSKPVTAQILPPNKKSILKNTNVLAPGMYKLHIKPTQTRTSQLLNDSSLNAKTLNVNFVCAKCGKCVLNENHDMCVLKSSNGVNSRTKMPIVVPVNTREPKHTVTQYVAKPLRKIVVSESNQKPRNITKKLYERFNVSNTPLSSNSFTARRDYPIHRRLLLERAEVYYECKEPFKSLMCLWVRSKSIAKTWLEKVVTPLIEPAVKVEFLRISLTGFRSCISRSQIEASQSRQTRYE